MLRGVALNAEVLARSCRVGQFADLVHFPLCFKNKGHLVINFIMKI